MDPAIAATLLGGERGLDHVGVAVKDLGEATRVYHDVLGFSRPVDGKLANGIRNVNYYFADSSYLETLTHWDRARAPWLAEFTDKRNGALFTVLAAHSPEATAAFLAKRGIAMSGPIAGAIEVRGQPPSADNTWKTFFVPDGLLAGDPLYFIAYPRAPRQEWLKKLESRDVRRQLYHENTALGLRAVWIAVPELEPAAKAYESIGLARKGGFEDAGLRAKCIAFEAGAGELRLVAPAEPGGPVRAFLDERGKPGIIGMTLMAGSVPAAQRLLAERLKHPIARYEGPYGDSFRIAPAETLGVWMEFAQYLVPPGK